MRDIVQDDLGNFMVEIRAVTFPFVGAPKPPNDQQRIHKILQDELRSTVRSFTPAALTSAPDLPTCSQMCP